MVPIPESLGGKKIIQGRDIAGALACAAKTAKAGVLNPREGTILSVARDGAAACAKYAKGKGRADIAQVLTDFYNAASASLEKTRNALKELKKAGVVDAGGQGLVLMFEGMLRLAAAKSVKKAPKRQ